MLLQFPHSGVAARHDVFQALIDLFLSPSQALNILRPFKITYGHPSRVGEDVWDDWNSSLIEDFIGLGVGGRIRGFDNGLRLDILGNIRREHSAERRRNKDVRPHHENLLIGNVRDMVAIIFRKRAAQAREIRQARICQDL